MPYQQPRKGRPGRLVSIGNPDHISQEQSEFIGRTTRALRVKKTPAEALFITGFAGRLHRRTGGEIRYVFQRPFLIGPNISFIVDFHFAKFKLAVELDGWQHGTESGREKDAWRASVLREYLSVETIRFENRALTSDPEGSWALLLAALASSPGATPSYQRRLQRAIAEGSLPFHWPKDAAPWGVYSRR